MEAISVSAKLTKREAALLEKLTREYGFISKSEAIRSAVRLYLNLLELRPKERLRMLQLINEMIAPGSKTSGELIEEAHRRGRSLKLYLEPSVLVKLFKREQDSAKMIDLIAVVDEKKGWYACTSRWSLLEVARALRKDGKPRELIELNLKELMRHRITYLDVTRSVISQAQSILASRNIYASDALHAASYVGAAQRQRLEAMLSDDRHFRRLENMVKVVMLNEIQVP
jgi:predicted nucleic acid-binding protein